MFRKKPAKPKSASEDFLDALKEVEKAHLKSQKERRKKKKLAWLSQAPGTVKAALAVALLAAVLLVADGIRREGEEMHAVVSAMSGQVFVLKPGKSWVAATRNLQLSDRDQVATGAGATAGISFPDGSSIQLEPSTHFEVRLLDYARGGVRDRSFMVYAGSVVAHFSKFFGGGAGSQGTICTPAAVAAVRGTGFRVLYDPANRQTYVAVVEGQVRFRTPTLEVAALPGEMGMASGYQLQQNRPLPAAAQTRIGGQVGQMQRAVRPPGFLAKAEAGLNSFLDPVLQVLGLTPGGWSYSATWFARRAACQEALRKLQQDIEARTEGAPDALNLVTLEELQIDLARRDAILDTFSGHMLDSYQKSAGRDSYAVRARARDRSHTLYELTSSGVKQVAE